MKVFNEKSVKEALAALNQMATAKVVEGDFLGCDLCLVSEG